MSGSINRHFPVVIAAICSTLWLGLGGCVSQIPKERARSSIPSPVLSPATQNPLITTAPTPLTEETQRSPIPSPVSPSPLTPTPLTEETERSPIPSPVTPSPLTPTTPTPIETGESVSAELYWLKDSGTKLELVPAPVKVAAGAPSRVLQGLFATLLNGSSDSNLTSAIPQGTKLRSIEVKNDGVHVNLSQEFTSGGGSASMSGRLGQIVYTATALDPKAPVWINVEGKKLEVLGGEGLEVEQPLTRPKFREDFDF